MMWFRTRWLDFRMGHSTYLIFLMGFANFILIFHRLLIERVDWLNDIVGELWFFVVLFVAVYVPLAIIVGMWHRKTQLKVDADLGFRQSPLLAKTLRVILDAHGGKATKQEIKAIRDMLHDIELRGEQQ